MDQTPRPGNEFGQERHLIGLMVATGDDSAAHQRSKKGNQMTMGRFQKDQEHHVVVDVSLRLRQRNVCSFPVFFAVNPVVMSFYAIESRKATHEV